MNKQTILLPLLGAFATQSAQAVSQPDQGKKEKPLNIIYIMTDDHAQQAISCYDKRYINTPNLDRLAEEGVRFTNSFVCNSISGPSRAVLMTGKHSHKNGKKDNNTAFNNDQQTFPKLLQNSGYQTAMIGKWHLEGRPQGFDFWEILPGQGEYYNPDFITPTGRVQYTGYVTNIITDKGIEFLENRDKDKPFCMLLHHKAVHRIWMGDLSSLKEFEDQTFEYPENFWDDYQGGNAGKQEMSIDKDMDLVYDLKMKDAGLTTPYGEWYIHGAYKRMNDEQKRQWDAHYNPIIRDFVQKNPQGKDLVNWKYQRYMRDYLKTVRALDNNVGRIYRYLEQNDLLDNTLIVYTSDQGFYMGEHGWFDKRFMYEESMRTPLIMRLPEGMSKRGRKIPQMVQNIDYAPTFLDIAGVDIPEDIQGVSLLPLIKGEKPAWRDALYYHYYEYPGEHAVRRHYGVRTNRYKLIHFYGKGGENGKNIDAWELYDLKKDPMEMHNLYGEAKYENKVKELKERLDQLQQQYDVKESDY